MLVVGADKGFQTVSFDLLSDRAIAQNISYITICGGNEFLLVILTGGMLNLLL
jgi:hypothetical protein